MRTLSAILFTCLLSFLFTGTAHTQWVQTGDLGAYVSSFAVSGTNLFAGTYAGGVFLSTNNGTSWTAVNSGLTDTNVWNKALAVSGTNLFVGTDDGGVFLSTNNGTSWTAVNSGLPPTGSGWVLAVSGTNLFAGTRGYGVFLSTNNGTSWMAVNSGLTGPDVVALGVTGTNLFAGTSVGRVWRRPLSEMITSVNHIESNALPGEYKLEQNYPNPFNPTTTIDFSIPHSGLVSIAVFNTVGQIVARLVYEELQPGHFRTTWDATGFSSGMYFYRLQAGSFSETRKLILLR